ncbi:hypothetical protein D3C86_1759290 [compost metagenome]
MGFHRAEANIESVGNLLVALAVGHAPQHILLAAGQWLEQQLGFARALRARCAENLAQLFAQRQRCFQTQLVPSLRRQQLAQQLALGPALRLQ